MSFIRLMPAYFHSPNPAPPATANIVAKSVTDFDEFTSISTAESKFAANGIWQGITRWNGTNSYTWLEAGSASDFEIRFTKYGTGAIPTFINCANNTWYAMSTDRSIYLEQTTTGIKSTTCYVTVRYAANSTQVANVTHSLSVDVKF